MEELKGKTVAQLKEIAEAKGLDLTGISKKADIIEALKTINEEEVEMVENVYKEASEEEEVVEGKEEVTEEVTEEGKEEVTEETKTTEESKKEFHLDDGSKCSRSAYIRQEFNKDRARKDIAKELDVKYYVVYSATANMYNAVHVQGAGSAIGASSIMVPKVDVNGNYVDAEGYIEDAKGQPIKKEDAAIVARTDLMRELATAGATRKELQKRFNLSYATVYAATKLQYPRVRGARAGVTIENPETGEVVKRVEYIRALYAEGYTRKEIAVKLTKITGELVDYTTVWAATKPAAKKEEDAEETKVADTEEVPKEAIEETK